MLQGIHVHNIQEHFYDVAWITILILFIYVTLRDHR